MDAGSISMQFSELKYFIREELFLLICLSSGQTNGIASNCCIGTKKIAMPPTTHHFCQTDILKQIFRKLQNHVQTHHSKCNVLVFFVLVLNIFGWISHQSISPGLQNGTLLKMTSTTDVPNGISQNFRINLFKNISKWKLVAMTSRTQILDSTFQALFSNWRWINQLDFIEINFLCVCYFGCVCTG